MADRDVPDFLTVPEAASILRIGRTAGYELARRWRETGGSEGLPVVEVGGQLRVPTALFEQEYSVCITVNPRVPAKTATTVSPEVRDLDVARSGTTKQPRRKANRTQDGLPFAG